MTQVTRKKALIIEDDSDILEDLTYLLKIMGFAVTSSSSGMDGVRKAIEEKPQLILMDIMMPVMDGREATRRIRSNPKTKDIPILATTALFNESDLSSCIEAGCSDYLIKPFTFQELQEKIYILFPLHLPCSIYSNGRNELRKAGKSMSRGY